ncbi:succinate dehydrogenase cytochrome b560 subunit [Nemania sp. FL0916]|nr:succinate dehydrogenase cytochrome b560 subunit [Nemania sp. FL0916]
MSAQRVGIRALQQVARPNAFSQTLPRVLLTSLQTRPASTKPVTPTEAQSLLASQRIQRPVAPHLSAYDYAQTWFSASVWTRITGGGFAGALYIFSITYLAAPLTGWHLESASLAAAAASLPIAVKGGLKMFVAWPFVFHLYNGVRHLAWDLALGFGKPVIKAGNWGIWGASLVTALGIVAFV